MLGFANDVKSCRKLLFLQYFKQSGVSSASFTSDDKEGEERCGHCDNVVIFPNLLSRPCLTTRNHPIQCTRSPESILSPDPLDLTLYAWRALKILRVCTDSNGRVTLTQMADLVRGLGGGSFGLSAGEGGKKGKGKGKLSLDEVAGGRVELGKDVSRYDSSRRWRLHLTHSVAPTVAGSREFLDPPVDRGIPRGVIQFE